MEEVEREARSLHVELLEAPTTQAIEALARGGKDTNAILHVTFYLASQTRLREVPRTGAASAVSGNS
jgi:hypothetical protein